MRKPIDPNACKQCPVVEACASQGDPDVCDETLRAAHITLGKVVMGGIFRREGIYRPEPSRQALEGLAEAALRQGHAAEDVEFPGDVVVQRATDQASS